MEASNAARSWTVQSVAGQKDTEHCSCMCAPLCVLRASHLWAHVPAVAAGVSPASGTLSCTRSHPSPLRCRTRCCWATTRPMAGALASLRGLSKLTQVGGSEPPSRRWPLLPAFHISVPQQGRLVLYSYLMYPVTAPGTDSWQPFGREAMRCAVQCTCPFDLTGCLLPRWA